MLEIITFTGVDARTDWGELAELAAQYPRAEFAALASPNARVTPGHQLVLQIGVRQTHHPARQPLRNIVQSQPDPPGSNLHR